MVAQVAAPGARFQIHRARGSCIPVSEAIGEQGAVLCGFRHAARDGPASRAAVREAAQPAPLFAMFETLHDRAHGLMGQRPEPRPARQSYASWAVCDEGIQRTPAAAARRVVPVSPAAPRTSARRLRRLGTRVDPGLLAF